MANGDLPAAEALLAEPRAATLPAQITEIWHTAFQAACLGLWRGDGPIVLSEARAVIDTARAMRRSGLALPAGAQATDWPLPLRLNVVGCFEVAIDGQPLLFKGKVHKRPLELLQAMAVHGPGPVPIARIVDDL